MELKAVKALTSEHEQQLLNYMHITKKAVLHGSALAERSKSLIDRA